MTPVSDKPKRNWRGTFFTQVKSDNQLRSLLPASPILQPIGLVHGNLSRKQASVAWDGYRQERHKIYEEAKAKQAIKHTAVQKNIAELEVAAKKIADIEEAKRAAFGY